MATASDETTRRVLIVGGGRGGQAMLNILIEDQLAEVVGVVDIDPEAPAVKIAEKHGIPTFRNVVDAVHACQPCLTFNLTGNDAVAEKARRIQGASSVVSGLAGLLIWRIVTKLQSTREQLLYEVQHDALTGVWNRRYILERLRGDLAEVARYRHAYSVVMIDIDHFKQINDRFGHAAGDRALVALASTLRRHMRASDHLGRWGGEEFLVLLPHTGRNQAARTAEKWRKTILDHLVDVGKETPLTLSFSAGVADCLELDAWQDLEQSLNRLVALADERLYRASRPAGTGL